MTKTYLMRLCLLFSLLWSYSGFSGSCSNRIVFHVPERWLMYHLRKSETLLSKEDKKKLKEFFSSRYQEERFGYKRMSHAPAFPSQEEDEEEDEKSLELVNIFYSSFTYDGSRSGLKVRSNRRELNDVPPVGKKNMPLIRRMTAIMLEAMQRSYASAGVNFYEPGHSIIGNTFGVRYRVDESGDYLGVHPHRDGCRYQALFILRRDRGLSEGQSKIISLRGPGHDGTPLAPGHVPFQVELDVPVNRLLVFEGENAEHGLESLEVSDVGLFPKYRDIVGICIP